MEESRLRDEALSLLKPFMRKVPGDFQVSNDTSLSGDLTIDSADMVDIVLAIEDRFGIAIGDEEIAGIKTFGDLITLVQRLSDRQG